MTLRRFAQGSIRKPLALLACFLLLEVGAPRLLAQASNATITGVVLDPAGRPAVGFRVILRETESSTVYTSAPTDAAGNYTLRVPVGSHYTLEGVRADDGVTKLPVQDVGPVSVVEPGTTRLNVRFTRGATPAGQAEEKNKKGGLRWYERPGPIVGIVFGAGVLAAIALDDGGGNASPSQPEQP